MTMISNAFQLRRQSVSTLYVEWIAVSDNRQVSDVYSTLLFYYFINFSHISTLQMEQVCRTLSWERWLLLMKWIP